MNWDQAFENRKKPEVKEKKGKYILELKVAYGGGTTFRPFVNFPNESSANQALKLFKKQYKAVTNAKEYESLCQTFLTNPSQIISP